ncbi:uncharacterized protein LOC107468046 [Arachis duranensis]|uniref:Uncharacterized protein LOC107468046 n=1 Tax=Arachis duranensis TaxID=130453 RepID=A0A6P4C466_ARADU|nr:uncharacterized protein LOC107468046 [Arachis duranensis]
MLISNKPSSFNHTKSAKEGLLPRVAAVRALSSPFCLPSSLNRHCSWSLPLSPFKLLLPPSHATSRSSTHRRRRRSEQRKRGRTTGKEGSHPRHHHRATLTANEASVVVVAERGLLLLSWPSSLPLQLHSILNCWNSPLVPIETFATNGSLRYKTAIGDIYKYYVDGHWKKSSSGKSVPIINPTARNTHYKVQVKFERDKERGVVAHRRAVLRKESQVAEHSRRLHAIETRINQDSSKMRKIVAKVSNLHRVKCIKLMQT